MLTIVTTIEFQEMRHSRNDGYKQSVVNDIVVTVVICKPYNKALEYLEKRNATVNC